VSGVKGRVYLEHSYLGIIEIIEEIDGISDINFVAKKLKEILSPEVLKCKKELEEYFSGGRTKFTVKIDFRVGTDFQKSCWKAMYKIPYGKTISYSEEAAMIGNPKAVRAVGGANSKNPISIVVP
jgi:methylated-DNA-[protein]-cysteine S-methyltransferase